MYGAIRAVGKTTGEIKIHIGDGTRTSNVRPKGLQADLRLPKRSAESASGGPWRLISGNSREVLVVDLAAVLVKIQQHNARKTEAVFRTTFDFGLVLIVELGFNEL